MAKDNRTFEQGYTDGYRSVQQGAPISIPSHTVPADKTAYEWGSIRSTERITGVHRDTIMRLGARVGHTPSAFTWLGLVSDSLPPRDLPKGTLNSPA
jgi:hypothetical protein